MNCKSYRVLILVSALIIIGTRGVCTAKFSQHSTQGAEVEKPCDLPGSISVSQSNKFPELGVAHRERLGASEMDQRIRGNFVFRVKRYVAPLRTYKKVGTPSAPSVGHVWRPVDDRRSVASLGPET